MRIDAINNFLNNPNANKIRLNGRYHRLPELYFPDSFIPTDIIGETPFPAPDEQAEAASLSAEIDRLCCSSSTSEREQFIIRSFYFAGKSMQEIAEILGLGVNWTIQLRRRALWKMRREITNAFSGGDE